MKLKIWLKIYLIKMVAPIVWFLQDSAVLTSLFVKNAVNKVIRFSSRRYRDIDELPIYNYFKVLNTGDTRYLMKNYKKLFVNFDKEWANIVDEVGERFGYDPNYMTLLYKEKELMLLYLDYLKTQNRKLITRIKILEKEINSLTSREKPQDYMEQIQIFESYFSVNFDVKRDSISKFFTYKKRYKKIADGKSFQKSA